MAKKTVKATIEFEKKYPPTLKQRFQAYRSEALQFISRLRYPTTQVFFSVKGYEVTPTGKKPNHISVPEMLAIIGTAAQLGKKIEARTSGIGDGGQIDFIFVDAAPSVPSSLQY